MYRNLKTIFLIILYAFISGCSTVMLQPNMELVKEQSKVYQKGFKHGCNSGYVAGGSILHNFSRDSEKMANDEEYKNGWKKDTGIARMSSGSFVVQKNGYPNLIFIAVTSGNRDWTRMKKSNLVRQFFSTDPVSGKLPGYPTAA